MPEAWQKEDAMKKIFLSALVLIVSAAVVFAGGSSESLGKVEIQLATADNTYGLSTDPDLQQSITDLIEEKTGVVVSPIVPPLSSYSDKIATLVNSGDIPDVFAVSQAMVKVPQMATRGQILDITDYIAASDTIKSMIPSSVLAIPDVGGRNYFVPYNYPKSKGIFIRQDVMDQYGIELSATPTTEEFLTEMSKLKGTGIEPFTFPKWVDNFQFFYNSFGAWGGIYLKDGKYVDGFQEPEMREALEYLHTLYEEGILNAEFITTENSQMREKVYTGQSAADIDYVTNYINYFQQTAAAGKPTEMHVVYALIGPDGDGGTLNEATQTALCISSKTKNPDAAFKVIETLVSDPELYSAFYGIGREGFHYTLNENGEITPTDKASNSGYKYTLNFLSDSFIDFDLDNLPYKLSEDTLAGIRRQREIIDEGGNYLGPNHSADVPVGVSDEYDRVSPSIKSTRESIAAKIVIGSVTLDEGMAEYENFWQSIRGPQILEELNASL